MSKPSIDIDPDDLMVWVDTETTGLSSITDYLLEVGITITGPALVPLATASTLVGPGSATVEKIERMRNEAMPFVRGMHDKSGLWDDLMIAAREDRLPNVREAENLLLGWLTYKIGTPTPKPPMCGSSVQFDREWLTSWMPDLASHFHYRNIDVSTTKEQARRWNRPLFDRVEGEGGDIYVHRQVKHRVVPDLEDTLAEMRYYRDHFLRTNY